METSSQQAAAKTAAYWYARLLAPDCRQDERTEFAEWLRHDANYAAFRCAERVVERLAEAAQSPRMQMLAEQALAADAAALAGIRLPWLPACISVALSNAWARCARMVGNRLPGGQADRNGTLLLARRR